MERTIRDISEEYGLLADTIQKAAKDKRIPGRQSGSIWLIDDELPEVKAWLSGAKKGRPRKQAPPS